MVNFERCIDDFHDKLKFSHKLSLSMITEGTIADHFLKVTVKLYKCLASAAKASIAPKGFKQHIPSFTFKMLAEKTCKRLTVPLYNFMAVMQRVCTYLIYCPWEYLKLNLF